MTNDSNEARAEAAKRRRREDIALATMNGILSTTAYYTADHAEALAKRACAFADALIAALDAE